MPDPKACIGCGALIVGAPSTVARRKYCNWQCRRTYMPPTRTSERERWSCLACGVTQWRIPSDTANKFCSMTCRSSVNGPKSRRRILCECPCGKTFEKRPSEIANGRGKHCSRECAMRHRPVHYRPSAIATAAIDLFLQDLPMLAIAEHRVGRWSIDLALPLQSLAIELDGIYWHSLPKMIDRDRRKDADLAAAGWQVERVVIDSTDTPRQVAQRIAAIACRRTVRR